MTQKSEMPGLTVGLVGAGGISPAHAAAWKAVGAAMRVYSLEGADRFADTHGATRVDSFDELIATSDLICVITPTPSHAALVERALRAGKDVVCEKPLARTTDDARHLVGVAAETGRRLFPAHVVRWFPQYAAAQQTVAAGGLGDLAVLRFTRAVPYPFDRGWYSDPVQSGGITMDLMIHDLDEALWMAGPVSTVYAQRRTASEPHPTETAHVVLTHTSGAISHCRGLWTVPKAPFWYTFSVSGTTGQLRYDSRDEVGYTLTTSPDDPPRPSPSTVALAGDPYSAEIADFVRAWRTGEPAKVSAEDGLVAVALAEAAELSAATGATVDFPTFLKGSQA
ncbi:Gfo/Idh/MocA family protein [Aestuariimicrobium sp. T2.26MG-19.2B]|uniref:Gfo/Idh/MocA family protein n=1 Tax=Aestuariimicrobium sp. T2.26MG-19.2B TaxID=3040679 RepID=UPI0024775D24|nr:Gfo/Idh/MocA family oxidoreductase [Aestuariimicrobium sp. T2.26MG-19.2B]CAI9400169.1 Myo-inositol 2-dehydrogenase [Aestuariimicrobium sp. T2.26MG-19.2B]